MDEDLVEKLMRHIVGAMAEAREHREEQLQAEGVDQAEIDSEMILLEVEHREHLVQTEHELRRHAAECLANGRPPAPGVLH